MELRIKNLVDVCVGPMTIEQICNEVRNYLTSCKQPSRLYLKIKRQKDGKFFTKIFMKDKDFKKKMCACTDDKVCQSCLDLLDAVFIG